MSSSNAACAAIDPTLPMELDDGTPVVLFRRIGKSSRNVLIKHSKAPTRPGKSSGIRGWERPGDYWAYHLDDGVFDGGNARDQFVLRNTATAFEPEEYEDWFV